jgi:hypothetical protein
VALAGVMAETIKAAIAVLGSMGFRDIVLQPGLGGLYYTENSGTSVSSCHGRATSTPRLPEPPGFVLRIGLVRARCRCRPPGGRGAWWRSPGRQTADTLAPRCFGRTWLASLTGWDQRRVGTSFGS